MLAALEDASLSPVSHYVQYGADEANAAGVALVQTVPSEQRVSNDPLRNDLGQNVPSNYNDPTPGPDAAEAAPVTKPADMGGLAAESISPGVVPPEAPVAVPGDDAYVAPTPGTVDTNEAPVVPETDPDSGLLVLPDAEPEPEPEPGTPGGGTSPSEPSFSVNETGDGISFTGVKDNSISLNVDENGTATFTSGDAVVSGVDITDRPINLENGQTLTADLADLNGLTVTGGTVEGRLPGENITTNEFAEDSMLDGWMVDRAEPAQFKVIDGQLQQVIGAPANGAEDGTFYGVQGYKFDDLEANVSSMSIDLTIPEEWLALEVPEDAAAIRLAGFWGRGGESGEDYPLIDVAVRKNDNGESKLGFYAWDTVTGELSLMQEIKNLGTHTLGIQVANDMYAYSIDGEVLGSTPIDEESTLPLSTVYLQGYSYASEKNTADDVTYATVDQVFTGGSYTITWDNFTTTTASSVTGDLDLSGISGLKLNAPLSVAEGATLTINAEQANDLIIIGKGDVKIDAADATEGVKVDTVAWVGSSDNWYNDKGFADGQLAAVTGSSGDDSFSLDLADIGTLTVNEDDNTVTFTTHQDLDLNGGTGNDTLMLTWFAPKGNEGHTLKKLNATNLFGHIEGFETIILNKGNASNNLQIDASSLGTHDDPVTLMLMSSGTIEGIHDGLVIGFTEPKLDQDVDFQLNATEPGSTLTLDIGTTNNHAIKLSEVTNISKINFLDEENITLSRDAKTISCSSPDENWKVILSGVDDGSSLSLDGNTLTIGNTGA